MTLAEILWARFTVSRVQRLITKAMRHQKASVRLGAKTARIMPEIAR